MAQLFLGHLRVIVLSYFYCERFFFYTKLFKKKENLFDSSFSKTKMLPLCLLLRLVLECYVSLKSCFSIKTFMLEDLCIWKLFTKLFWNRIIISFKKKFYLVSGNWKTSRGIDREITKLGSKAGQIHNSVWIWNPHFFPPLPIMSLSAGFIIKFWLKTSPIVCAICT